MAKIIEFPANKIGKGTHVYWPEMGERKVNTEIYASLGHYGTHYFIKTKLDLKGRGITFLGVLTADRLVNGSNNKYCGWNEYKVTRNAYEKLEKEYSIGMERLLD